MKLLLHLFFVISLIAVQASAPAPANQETFLKVTDASGQLIRGTSTAIGFERQILAQAFSGYVAGSPDVSFSMPAGSATAALATAQTGKQTLPYALFTNAIYDNPRPRTVSTVRLEDVKVVSVSEANGSAQVTFKAKRLGVTYYTYNQKTGTNSVSGKTGYDFGNKQAWTKF